MGGREDFLKLGKGDKSSRQEGKRTHACEPVARYGVRIAKMKVSEPICGQSAASSLPPPPRAPPGSGEWVARSEPSRGAAPRDWPASAGAPTWPAQ